MRSFSLSSALTMLISTAFLTGIVQGGEKPDVSRLKHPLPEAVRKEFTKAFQDQVQLQTEAIRKQPDSLSAYSRRGDALFFLGQFDKAVKDYEKMVEIDPKEDARHWRRGIARFYAGDFKRAAHQFEIYHTFDDVDRENGIWRYFSQFKAYGPKKAREGLLKYRKDDREPFPSVYRLFSGELKGDRILEDIKAADIDDNEREKRNFYANLYIGLNHAIEGRDAMAMKYLQASTANRWGPVAGFGPKYMWHVGRLHFELLAERLAKKVKKAAGSASEQSAKN